MCSVIAYSVKCDEPPEVTAYARTPRSFFSMLVGFWPQAGQRGLTFLRICDNIFCAPAVAGATDKRRAHGRHTRARVSCQPRGTAAPLIKHQTKRGGAGGRAARARAVNGSYTRVTKRSLLDVTRRGTLLLPHSSERRSETLGVHSPPNESCTAEMACSEAQTSRREAVPQNVTSAVADSNPSSRSQIGVERTWQVHGASRPDTQTLTLTLA